MVQAETWGPRGLSIFYGLAHEVHTISHPPLGRICNCWQINFACCNFRLYLVKVSRRLYSPRLLQSTIHVTNTIGKGKEMAPNVMLWPCSFSCLFIGFTKSLLTPSRRYTHCSLESHYYLVQFWIKYLGNKLWNKRVLVIPYASHSPLIHVRLGIQFKMIKVTKSVSDTWEYGARNRPS